LTGSILRASMLRSITLTCQASKTDSKLPMNGKGAS
jgi:hypothetical protein